MYNDGNRERLNRFRSYAMRRKSELTSNKFDNSMNKSIDEFDSKQMITPQNKLNIDLTPPLPPISEDYINLKTGLNQRKRISHQMRSSYVNPSQNNSKVTSSNRQNSKNIRTLNPTPTHPSNYDEIFINEFTGNNSNVVNQFSFNKSPKANALNFLESESIPFPLIIERKNQNFLNQSLKNSKGDLINTNFNSKNEIPKLIDLNLNDPNQPKPRIRKFSFVRKYLKSLDLKSLNLSKLEFNDNNQNQNINKEILYKNENQKENINEEKSHDALMNKEKGIQSRNIASNLIINPNMKLDINNDVNRINNNVIQRNVGKIKVTRLKGNSSLNFTTLTSFNLVRSPIKKSKESPSIIRNPGNLNNNSQHHQRRISYLINPNADFYTGIDKSANQIKEDFSNNAGKIFYNNQESINNVILWLQNNIKEILLNVFLIRLKMILKN